ncbi:MAG: Na+/H+ antiporter subunit E [Rhodobacteraceae bacterium]|nr:Na+/H+ antiporter subunit E [Paracoccaceae bacterium]
MIKRLFPHPILTVMLTITWLFLAHSSSLNSILFGLMLGILIPFITAPFWPDRPALRNPLMIVEYILLVMWDIVVANIEVARIILFKANKDIHPAWVTVPLKLTSVEAITVLAGTITLTPGTVTAMVSADGSSLLVHCLHTDDPDAVVAEIKNRYERRLLKAFR